MTIQQMPAARRLAKGRLGCGLITRLGLWCLAGPIALVAAPSTFAAPEFSAAEIYRNSASSVVLIFGFGESGPGHSGAGSILTRDGLVLTNNHVIANSKTGRLFPNLVIYRKPVTPTPTPKQTASPAASSDLPRGLRPLREVSASDLEPQSEPESMAKPLAPEPLRPPPSLDPKARAFEGTNGESMYGVPNSTIDLHETLVEVRKSYEALTRRADESVDEMNRLLDDYDNF